MKTLSNDYRIRIEYNNEYAGLHPISVLVIIHGDQVADYHGKRLLGLLNDVRNFIISEEEKEAQP